MKNRLIVALLATLALAAACASYALSSSSAAATTPITHVVLIAEENHNATVAKGGMPYLVSLGNKYAQTGTSNYSAISHPSLPNYFALTAGSTFGVTSDCGTNTSTCSQSADNIFHQAGQSAGGWAGWAESMPKNCDHANASPYVVHHAPAPFYTDLGDCATYDVAFNKLSPRTITAGFTFLTPNNNDNAHDGTLGAADSWLKTVLPKLMAQPNYTNGSTLIEVTFDEGSSGNNHVYTVFINPQLVGKGTLTGTYNHYGLLKLNEDLLGVPELANARSANSMRGALGL